MTQHPQRTHTTMNSTNDNSQDDPLPFIALSALVANVVRYLENPKDKGGNDGPESPAKDTDEEKAKRHRDYVDQRLRELAAFERRARG